MIAENANEDTVDPSVDSAFIKEISYEYQMIYNEKGADCTGTLNISMSPPEGTEGVILARSVGHDRHGRLIFALKDLYTDDLSLISAHGISWGTYFMLEILLMDGNRIYSDIYYTDDFISEEDLQLIRQQSALDDISTDKAPMIIKNRHLSVENPDITYIELSDIYGRIVYSGPADREIPIEHISTPFIIARYMLSDNFFTSKILIQ